MMRSRLAPRVRHRNRGQQAPGYRDAADLRTVRDWARFDDAAQMHHRDAVGNVLDHGKIVRNENVGQAEPPLQVAQQIEDLRADRDIERRDRLVADDELRLDRERAGDRDALALAAGKFVRITLRDHTRRRARPAAAARHALRHGAAPARRRARTSGSASICPTVMRGLSEA